MNVDFPPILGPVIIAHRLLPISYKSLETQLLTQGCLTYLITSSLPNWGLVQGTSDSDEMNKAQVVKMSKQLRVYDIFSRTS